MSKYPAPEPLVRAAFETLLTSICSECRGRGFVQGVGCDDQVWTVLCPGCDGLGIDPADLEHFCRREEAQR
jgi:DnaJ-class molecular chaperone